METKYWNALLSEDYADIHGLIAQLIDASLGDPSLVEREFQWFGIDKKGAVRLPSHAPPRLKEAPHLIAFLHWKEGFIAAQRLIQERQKVRDFLGSKEIEEVRVGLNLLESLAIDKPNMFDLIVGPIEEGKYGIQIPKWLQLAPFRSYVCVYALAWKAKNGDPVQRDRTALKMGSYKARRIPENIDAFTQLRVLNYVESSISEFPPTLSHLSQLEEVYLSDSSIKVFPSFLFSLPHLRTLSLSDNWLQSIPSEIGRLTSLQYLSIGANELKGLPESIAQLTQLKTLEISWTNMSTFPAAVTKITSLQKIGLRGAKYESLPVDFNQLTALKRVSLDESKQKKLKDAILKIFPQMEFGFVY